MGAVELRTHTAGADWLVVALCMRMYGHVSVCLSAGDGDAAAVVRRVAHHRAALLPRTSHHPPTTYQIPRTTYRMTDQPLAPVT